MSIPLPKVYWPRTVSGLNNRIPVRYSGVTYNANLATVVTHYSAETLRAAVLTALNSVLPALGWTVSLDLVFPGSLSIFANSAFALWWASSPSSIANEHLGFYSGFDVSSSGNRIDSPFQIANAFYPSVAVANDTRDTKERTADRITVAMSGQTKRIVETELVKRAVTFQFEAKEKTFRELESGTKINAAADRWWGDGAARFRYWPDRTVEATYGDYTIEQEAAQKWEPRRMFLAPELYEFEIKMRKFVP